jgi:hypothetical protein
MAGRVRFELTTSSLEGTKIHGLNLDQYRTFLDQKYSKSYASQIFFKTVKHADCLDDPSKILAISPSIRHTVLKALVCVSKYLGFYEDYKAKLKGYGIKWNNEDTAFKGFLSIFSKQHDTLGFWVKQVQPILHYNEKLLLRFLSLTGLRKGEAVTAFNMIIELNSMGKLGEYYNSELSVLEHYKYKVFLRGTKNAYISFVNKAMMDQICCSKPVNYTAILSRLRRKHIPLRFKELRSYHNSYFRKQGIISELVDVLAGRVPKSVFARHYLGEDIKNFSCQVLEIENNLEKTLLS